MDIVRDEKDVVSKLAVRGEEECDLVLVGVEMLLHTRKRWLVKMLSKRAGKEKAKTILHDAIECFIKANDLVIAIRAQLGCELEE